MSFDFKALRAPFDPNDVQWRVGSTTKDKSKGMALAYVDARAVMDRLDDVCGQGGWQCRYSHANGKTVCDIAVKCGEEWIWKADGAGDSDIEAEKGALSDAFKRAAVRWGIGRYLYELDSPWVKLDEWKHIEKAEYATLNRILANKSRALGWTGQTNDWAGDAKADGLTTETRSHYDIAAEKKARVWTDTAKEAVRFATEPRALNEWLEEQAKALDRLEAKFPDLHADLMKVVGEVRDGLQARAA
jgi:hypothetical protein